jgi:hypothetical protein
VKLLLNQRFPKKHQTIIPQIGGFGARGRPRKAHSSPRPPIYRDSCKDGTQAAVVFSIGQSPVWQNNSAYIMKYIGDLPVKGAVRFE